MEREGSNNLSEKPHSFEETCRVEKLLDITKENNTVPLRKIFNDLRIVNKPVRNEKEIKNETPKEILST